jgi:hypothetical protein
MANPYYGVTGIPAAATRGISASPRNEFLLIQTGFDSVYNAIGTTLPASIATKGAITGQTWTGTHDYTGGSIKVPTLTYGTTGSFAVSMDTLNAAVFAAANLPAQTGNSGKSLTTNGTTPSWSYPGLTLLATLTPTAAAAVNALNVFSSLYDSYLVIGEGLCPATDAALAAQFAVSGVLVTTGSYATTSSFVATASAYLTSVMNMTSVVVGAIGGGANMMLRIDNANDATNTKSLAVSICFDSPTPQFVHSQSAGGYKGGVITGIGFSWGGGVNFKAQGSIRIYGIQKV